MLALLLAAPSTALAHSFGQSYRLPVPLWLYAWGAVAALMLSFVVAVYFLRAGPGGSAASRGLRLSGGWARVGLVALQVLALAALLLGHGARQVWRCAVPPMEVYLVPRPLRDVMASRARQLDAVLTEDSAPPLYRLPYHAAHLRPSYLAASGLHPGAPLYAELARRLAREIRARV